MSKIKPKHYLTTKELAYRWRLQIKTLHNWRAQMKGPKFVKIMGKVLYEVEEVEKWEVNETGTLQ